MSKVSKDIFLEFNVYTKTQSMGTTGENVWWNYEIEKKKQRQKEMRNNLEITFAITLLRNSR